MANMEGDGATAGTDNVDENVLTMEAAMLVEDQRAYIEQLHEQELGKMRGEVAEWLGDILGESLQPEELYDELKSGVRLLHAAKSLCIIKRTATNQTNNLEEELKQLSPEVVAMYHNSAQATARQRINIAKFLHWCREMGVRNITLFESQDLVSGRNERQVWNCILNIAKIVSRYGVQPPQSVLEELQLEKQRQEIKQSNRPAAVQQATHRRDDHQDPSRYSRDPTVDHTEENWNRAAKAEQQPAVMGKIKGGFHTIQFFKKKLQVGTIHRKEEATVTPDVTSSTLGDGRKKKIVTAEIGDMVVVDTLDLSPTKNVAKVKPSPRKAYPVDPDLLHDTSDMNENSRCHESTTGTESGTTSENEYYTALDASGGALGSTKDTTTRDEDIGSLLYHTAFMDDIEDEEEPPTDQIQAEEKDLEEDACPTAALHGTVASEDSSYGNQATMEYTTPKRDLSKMFAYYDDCSTLPRFDAPKSEALRKKELQSGSESSRKSSSTSSCRELDLSNGHILATASSYRSYSDEVMIDFPPSQLSTSNIRRPSAEFMARAALSSTPSSSPSTSRRSLSDHESIRVKELGSFHQGVVPLASVTPLAASAAHLRRRTSSTSSSGSSSLSQHQKIARRRGSMEQDHDPRSPIATSDQTAFPLANDIVRVINEMGDVYSLPRPKSKRRSPRTLSAQREPPTVAVIQVESEQVHVSRSSSSSSVRDRLDSTAGSNAPANDSKHEPTPPVVALRADHIDVETGLGHSSPPKRQRSFREIVKEADRYRLPLIVVAVFLLLAIAGLVAMAVVFPLS